MTDRPLRRATPLPAPGDPPQVDTLPAPPPWAVEFIREVKATVADMVFEIGHVNTRLTALEGGVKMLLAGDQETQGSLKRIEASIGELVRVTSGSRHAQDDLRERVESLEEWRRLGSNGHGAGE